jgi:hypothetical protein
MTAMCSWRAIESRARCGRVRGRALTMQRIIDAPCGDPADPASKPVTVTVLFTP